MHSASPSLNLSEGQSEELPSGLIGNLDPPARPVTWVREAFVHEVARILDGVVTSGFIIRQIDPFQVFVAVVRTREVDEIEAHRKHRSAIRPMVKAAATQTFRRTVAQAAMPLIESTLQRAELIWPVRDLPKLDVSSLFQENGFRGAFQEIARGGNP